MKSQTLSVKIPQVAFLVFCAFAITNVSARAATVLINDTFESYTLGTTPTNPSDGNTNNWVKSANLTTASVIAGSSPGGVAPNGKILALSRSTGTGYTSLNRKFTKQDSITLSTGDYLELSFDLKVNSFASSDYMIILGNSTNQYGGPVQLRLNTAGQVVAYYGNGSVGGAPLLTPFLTITSGIWYQFTLNVNLLDQKYALTLINLVTSAQQDIATGYFQQNVTSLDNFLIRSTSTTSDNLALDWELNDISLNVVPEPTVFIMSLFGIMVLFAIHGRRKIFKRA